MACPECSSDTSTAARNCPHCGYPIKQNRPPGAPGSVLTVFFSIPTLVAVIAVVSFNASWWVVAPLWLLVMTVVQWALVVQRREWRSRYLTSIPEPSAQDDGVERASS